MLRVSCIMFTPTSLSCFVPSFFSLYTRGASAYLIGLKRRPLLHPVMLLPSPPRICQGYMRLSCDVTTCVGYFFLDEVTTSRSSCARLQHRLGLFRESLIPEADFQTVLAARGVYAKRPAVRSIHRPNRSAAYCGVKRDRCSTRICSLNVCLHSHFGDCKGTRVLDSDGHRL